MSSTELSSLKGSGKRLVHSPWVSAVSAHLLSRGADDFGSGLPFSRILSGEDLEDRVSVFFWSTS